LFKPPRLDDTAFSPAALEDLVGKLFMHVEQCGIILKNLRSDYWLCNWMITGWVNAPD